MTARRALRTCAEPGCPELVRPGHACPRHPPRRSPSSARPAKDPAQARFYSSRRWQKLRAQVRREEPSCRMCGARSETVDHIDANWQNNARSNLRALCRPCERSHTGRQHRAKRRDHQPRGVDASGRPIDPGHHWNAGKRPAQREEEEPPDEPQFFIGGGDRSK